MSSKIKYLATFMVLSTVLTIAALVFIDRTNAESGDVGYSFPDGTTYTEEEFEGARTNGGVLIEDPEGEITNEDYFMSGPTGFWDTCSYDPEVQATENKKPCPRYRYPTTQEFLDFLVSQHQVPVDEELYATSTALPNPSER